jgi:large subunit ribosomal protein L31e
MAEERIYTIPLRIAYLKPKTRRAKIATRLLKEFLTKHMKSENIKIGSSINHAMWARGIQKPPRHIRIHTIKVNDIVYSEMIDTPIKTPSKDDVKKKEQKEKAKKEKIKEERKERRGKTIQEEIEEEHGKGAAEGVVPRESDLSEKKGEDEKDKQEKHSAMQKETGKA